MGKVTAGALDLKDQWPNGQIGPPKFSLIRNKGQKPIKYGTFL
jgi:hypothetical protein